jgi:hypothetical protein
VDISVLIEPKLDLERLSVVLDGFGHEGRVHAMRCWNRRHLERLFDALTGFRALTLEHFVPAAQRPLEAVIHHGKNSLPVASLFEKRFCRPVQGVEGSEGAGVLFGYNHQAFTPFTGAGYFVIRRDDAAGEAVFDYRQLPTATPETWPPIRPNEERLGRFVYAGMVDRVRALSSHVVVGRAYKGERPMSAWFALCREDA